MARRFPVAVLVAALVAALLLLPACAGDGDGEDGDGRGATLDGSTSSTASPSSGAPSSSPAPSRPPSPAPTGVRLVEVARLDQPVALAVRPGQPGLFVAEKTGRVRAVVDGAVRPDAVLDLSREVSTGFEQGLLGIAWSPDGRLLYANYTDRQGDTHLIEVDPATGDRRELLRVDQPYANHNGGQVLFGPDGMLYTGLGDGGSGGDPHGNGQNLGTLLGSILRIDPRPSGGRPYTIPPGNPFAGRAGARPEIWSYGLRNPWRFTFDRATGDMWIGDVGQNAWEEVNFAPAGSKGQNWGWGAREGAHSFRGRPTPEGAVDPVHEYPLENGACAVVGGYVYRGSALAALLEGQYVFTDTCLGTLWALRRDGSRTAVRELGVKAENVSSLAEDAAGELYVLSLRGPVFRLDPK